MTVLKMPNATNPGHELLASALASLDRAAKAIGLDPGMHRFLQQPERTLIGSILVDLVQREGLCTLIIEHDLDFVREISTRIIVLHQGKVLLDGSVAEVVGSELVRTIYAGRAHQELAP